MTMMMCMLINEDYCDNGVDGDDDTDADDDDDVDDEDDDKDT